MISRLFILAITMIFPMYACADICQESFSAGEQCFSVSDQQIIRQAKRSFKEVAFFGKQRTTKNNITYRQYSEAIWHSVNTLITLANETSRDSVRGGMLRTFLLQYADNIAPLADHAMMIYAFNESVERNDVSIVVGIVKTLATKDAKNLIPSGISTATLIYERDKMMRWMIPRSKQISDNGADLMSNFYVSTGVKLWEW